MEASAEFASVEAFMEASMKVASVEVASVEDSVQALKKFPWKLLP